MSERNPKIGKLIDRLDVGKILKENPGYTEGEVLEIFAENIFETIARNATGINHKKIKERVKWMLQNLAVWRVSRVKTKNPETQIYELLLQPKLVDDYLNQDESLDNREILAIMSALGASFGEKAVLHRDEVRIITNPYKFLVNLRKENEKVGEVFGDPNRMPRFFPLSLNENVLKQYNTSLHKALGEFPDNLKKIEEFFGKNRFGSSNFWSWFNFDSLGLEDIKRKETKEKMRREAIARVIHSMAKYPENWKVIPGQVDMQSSNIFLEVVYIGSGEELFSSENTWIKSGPPKDLEGKLKVYIDSKYIVDPTLKPNKEEFTMGEECFVQNIDQEHLAHIIKTAIYPHRNSSKEHNVDDNLRKIFSSKWKVEEKFEREQGSTFVNLRGVEGELKGILLTNIPTQTLSRAKTDNSFVINNVLELGSQQNENLRTVAESTQHQHHSEIIDFTLHREKKEAEAQEPNKTETDSPRGQVEKNLEKFFLSIPLMTIQNLNPNWLIMAENFFCKDGINANIDEKDEALKKFRTILTKKCWVQIGVASDNDENDPYTVVEADREAVKKIFPDQPDNGHGLRLKVPKKCLSKKPPLKIV